MEVGKGDDESWEAVLWVCYIQLGLREPLLWSRAVG